jgi:alpha-L-arabinofuranosidase
MFMNLLGILANCLWLFYILCAPVCAGIKPDHDLQGKVMKNSITIEPKLIISNRINPYQYGQFIEYLYDVVPGMWAEKLYDQSFEGPQPYNVSFRRAVDNREKPWYPMGGITRAQYALDEENPVNGKVSQRIAIAGDPATLGIAQDGVYAAKSTTDTVSVYLRSAQPGLTVFARLRSPEGNLLAEAHWRTTTGWKKYKAKLTPTATTKNATFSFEFRGPGTLWLDQASLMPEDTIGGWRPEVVEAIRDLNCGIIRFGGCTIECYEWRDLIGDPDRRPPWLNVPWGAIHPTGAGLGEVIDLIQMVGADVLWCIRVSGRPPEEAAAQVEYFNGAVTTPMGALRAKHGHPKPYNIKYWQVGNEVGGDEYAQQLADCCAAMKKADPSILIMSSYPSEAVLRLAGAQIDYICPHHYTPDIAACETDLQNLRKLIDDNSPNKNIKIGVTEWNTTAGDWGVGRNMLWTLDNALAVARYHNMIHKYAGFVAITNRSNLTNSLCSGIIQTDNSTLYKTPAYYAQQLYANHVGVWPVAIKTTGDFDSYDVSATLSERGDKLTLCIINRALKPVDCSLDLSALEVPAQTAKLWTVEDSQQAGERDVTNSFQEPLRIRAVGGKLAIKSGKFSYKLPEISLSVVEVRVKGKQLLP